MCVDACTFGALTYEEKEEPVKAEEEKPGDMEIVFEALVKKHGKKKVMETFTRLSRE
jgi:benzoyl-CoA reductase subunit BamC